MDIKSVTVACGHTATGTMGSGAADLLDESNCTREIGPYVCSYLKKEGIKAQYIRVDKGNAYNYEDCYVRASQANCIGSDLYVEIHLNSGKKRTGDGAEVLISSTDTTTKEIAARVSSSVAKALGIEDRGVKFANLIVLKRTSMRAILVEVMFVDTNDISNYNPDIIGAAVASGILGYSISTEPTLGWNKSKDGTKWWYCTDLAYKSYYKSCWKYISGSWYLFDAQGFCKTGWTEYEGSWYYLDKESCSMATGWKKIDNAWYYFNGSGSMQTGWIKDKGKDYCMYSTGEMIAGVDMYGYRFAPNGEATKI